MTVSRAINNHPLISAETRERVLEVARRLNYPPNQPGIVVPDLMNLYFAEVACAVESIARPAGFQLLICSAEEDRERELGEVATLLHRADGLIISSVPARDLQFGDGQWVRTRSASRASARSATRSPRRASSRTK